MAAWSACRACSERERGLPTHGEPPCERRRQDRPRPVARAPSKRAGFILGRSLESRFGPLGARSLLEDSVSVLEETRNACREARRSSPFLLSASLRSLAKVLTDLGELDHAAELQRRADELVPRFQPAPEPSRSGQAGRRSKKPRKPRITRRSFFSASRFSKMDCSCRVYIMCASRWHLGIEPRDQP